MRQPKHTPSSAGRALSAARWAGHERADWKTLKLRSTTLDDLRQRAAELGGLTIDGTVRHLLDNRQPEGR